MDLTLPEEYLVHINEVSDMLALNQQVANEEYFSRRHINRSIDEEIRTNPDSESRVKHGVKLLEDWLKGDYYKQKNARLVQINTSLLEEIVRDVFISVAYCTQAELYVSVTAQLANRMGFDSHRDSIITIAEICAVLCHTDAFHIYKEDTFTSLMIVNRLPLSADLLAKIERSFYVPPMICPPLPVESNYESAHLSFNDSVVLGQGNNHNEDLCLDVINTQNNIALTLDIDFLSQVPEEPTHVIDTQEKLHQWDFFKHQSNEIYQMLHDQGNKFWLTNKVDKRGRLYCMGYHVTAQGSPFKKAMLELATTELVEGVPNND